MKSASAINLSKKYVCKSNNFHTEAMMHPPRINTYVVVENKQDTKEAKGACTIIHAITKLHVEFTTWLGLSLLNFKIYQQYYAFWNVIIMIIARLLHDYCQLRLWLISKSTQYWYRQ